MTVIQVKVSVIIIRVIRTAKWLGHLFKARVIMIVIALGMAEIHAIVHGGKERITMIIIGYQEHVLLAKVILQAQWGKT